MKNTKWLVVVCVVGFLGLMAALAVLSMQDDSATYDELAHIPAGYSYLTQQDFRLNPEHPPLVKDLAAFPLLFLNPNFPYEDPSWTEDTNGQWKLGQLFLYERGNDVEQILFWARLPMVFVLVVLGWFLFYWTRELAGQRTALLVLTLFAFSPTFLAHGRLVTNDVGAALGVVTALYFYLKFLHSSVLRNILFAGLFLGFALLLKSSTILLIPFFALLAFVFLWICKKEQRKYLHYAISMSVIGLIALTLVGIVYQLHLINYPVEQQVRDSQEIIATRYGIDSADVHFDFATNPLLRPYAHYFLGTAIIFQKLESQSVEFFLGNNGVSGWWYYYPVLYLFKVPLAFHVLTLIAVTVGIFALRRFFQNISQENIREWAKSHFTVFAMGFFIVFYSSIAFSSPLNIGFRHMIPILPFMYIIVALGIKKWITDVSFPSFRVKVAVLILFGTWYISSSIAVFPSYLSYYNELAGGSANGYKIAVNSNYDWGQDLKRLADWVEVQGIQKIYVDYFSRGNSEQYYLGDAYLPWKGSFLWRYPSEEYSPAKFPPKNYLAVSATLLQGGKENQRDYAWLDEYEPVARIGNSFFVYYIN